MYILFDVNIDFSCLVSYLLFVEYNFLVFHFRSVYDFVSDVSSLQAEFLGFSLKCNRPVWKVVCMYVCYLYMYTCICAQRQECIGDFPWSLLTWSSKTGSLNLDCISSARLTCIICGDSSDPPHSPPISAQVLLCAGLLLCIFKAYTPIYIRYPNFSLLLGSKFFLHWEYTGSFLLFYWISFSVSFITWLLHQYWLFINLVF